MAILLLTIAFTLNFVDRQVINILAEPIKHELHLADWQVGLMSGLAFALLYTVAGIPIARLADKGDRPRIISVSIFAWSAFTVACSMARNFPQLLLGRVGVGLGEAGLTPAATSLIVDYSPRERRASALSLYFLGVPIGTLAGMAMGGIVADVYGWRTAFVVAGLPGVLMAPVLAFALREPRRSQTTIGSSGPRLGFLATLRQLWSIRTYRLIVMATAIQGVVGYGFAPFLASFFMRNHGAEVASLAASFGLRPAGFLGLSLGLSTGLAGAVGVWLGGALADRLGRNDLRAYVTIPAMAAMLSLPCYILIFNLDSVVLALIGLAVPNVLGAMWMGPIHSTQQSVSPREIRSSATALFLFVLNLISVGLGPLLVGALSDGAVSLFGDDAGSGLRTSLITVSFLAPLSAFLFWSARRSIREDYKA
ncbi:spinster family MFS transporter [Novosphingobium marinum]|uniref:spinster family MFS transporter n=1 Tax=Novosphingobium marinum TaxID=1514948 RepID=UPI001C541591|nr:MFS transporter [Novosphingobium marinum]